MRLPWGELPWIVKSIGTSNRFSLLGCLSFEDRCLSVPSFVLSSGLECDISMLRIVDPPDAFPDYSGEARNLMDENAKKLDLMGGRSPPTVCDLLATEDELISYVNQWKSTSRANIFVLDISSLPKRYFCFILKRLLLDADIKNVIATYCDIGHRGYADGTLAEDPMPFDHLPGFGPFASPTSSSLVVSVGFETLNMSSLVKLYRGATREVKFLLSFPGGSVDSCRRQWSALREIAWVGGSLKLRPADIDVVSLWDAERVFHKIARWNEEVIARHGLKRSTDRNPMASVLSLAPFGPKPHSLAMALFAMKHRCGLYYSQPKSYNPKYSRGFGSNWAFVVKWKGIACFDRLI